MDHLDEACISQDSDVPGMIDDEVQLVERVARIERMANGADARSSEPGDPWRGWRSYRHRGHPCDARQPARDGPSS